MKPIKLTMRAFGPYKREEIIDFTRLHDNRLFVISGTTGAGKTTIFDGICFALYGQGSGSDRKDTKMLRSDFAEDDVHTAVELVFEIHDKTYRVLRQLPHVKKGRKAATGEKYELFEINENSLEIAAVERQKVTDINQKIVEIIGLTYDQFSQIVMLPQGEFRKLLTSQTENKEEILRKIFKTNRYGEMAQKLEVKKQQAEQQLNKAQVIKNSYIEQISGALPRRDSHLFSVLDKQSNIYQIQDALREELSYYQEKIIEDYGLYEKAFELHKQKYDLFIANKTLNDRIDNYEKNVIKLTELQQQNPIYERMKFEYDAAIRASQIEPIYQHLLIVESERDTQQQKLEQVTRQLELAKVKLSQSKVKYEDEQKNHSKREAALKKVLELEKLIPAFEEIEKLQKLVASIEEETVQHKEKISQLENQLQYKKGLRGQLNASIEQLELNTEKIQEIIDEQNRLKEVIQLFNQYSEFQKELTLLNEQYEQVLKNFENAKEHYEIEELKWLNNQASILAAKLSPGEPCPVCGSVEHQIVNRDHGEIVDEKVLKQLKDSLSKVEQRKFEYQATIHATNTQLENIKEALQSNNVKIEEQASLFEKYNEVSLKIERLQKENELLTIKRKQLKVVLQEEQTLESQFKLLEQQYTEKNNQHIQQKTILEQKQLSIPVELKTLSELQRALHLALKDKMELEQQWEIAQKQYQSSLTEVATTEENLKLTSLRVEEAIENLKKHEAQFRDALNSARFESIDDFIRSKRTELEQKHLYDQYLKFTKVLHSLTEQVKIEKEQLDGKEKIDLKEAQEELDGLKRDYERAHQILNESKNIEQICLDYLNKLQHIGQEIVDLEETSNQIVDLYNVLRGQNNKKVSFERYVQMGYLEQITEAANIRLKNLSNGQFYLQCSDRQESHGRQSGLSLDVYDTYTGQSRDVKSLSGGEKFNASLCLALGLADVIQSYQGNVRIDTMFIDEGFGSLDEESLMKAIDTLIDLQKSGRMIGVISHVAELKAAMPAILQVEKLKEGYSKTSIILK